MSPLFVVKCRLLLRTVIFSEHSAGLSRVNPAVVSFLQILFLCRLDASRRKKAADGTAFRSQRPRCHSQTSDGERGEDVKCISAVTAYRSARCGRASQVKENPGIRPFLETRKTWREYGNGPKHFPK